MEFDFPGPHAQRLTTMRPKPGVKPKADDEQISRIEHVFGRKGFAGIEGQQDGGCKEQHRQ